VQALIENSKPALNVLLILIWRVLLGHDTAGRRVRRAWLGVLAPGRRRRWPVPGPTPCSVAVALRVPLVDLGVLSPRRAPSARGRGPGSRPGL
jgi:hypothetical protein